MNSGFLARHALALCCWAQQIAGQPTATWSVEAQPTIRLHGEASGSPLLEFVVGATRLPDGGILVGDRGDFALRFFDAKGNFVQRVGRKGAGPGEITYLARMYRCGDSLYTYDIDNGERVSVFALDGRYVRAFRFPAPTGSVRPYLSTCNGRGTFGHLGWDRRADARAGAHRAIVPIWLSRAEEGTVTAIDSVPGSERWGFVRDGHLADIIPRPLGRQPTLGLGRDRLYVGSAERFVVRVLDLAGRTVGTLKRPGTPPRSTKADFDALIDAEAAGRSAADREGLAKAYAGIELPETLPAYTHIVVDALDFPWVRAYARPNAGSATWSVFTVNGALIAEVKLPAGLDVYEIGRDYVLGRMIDADTEKPEVHLYRLIRSSAKSR